MKKDILKIAGVKSEKELYAKYGTEAEFMAKHGKAFKKAAMGASMVKKQLTQLTDYTNPPQAQTGWHSEWNQDPYAAYDEDAIIEAQNIQNVAATPMKPLVIKPPMAGARTTTKTNTKEDFDPSNIYGGLKNVVEGGQQMFEDIKNLKNYKMWGKIADVSGKAIASGQRNLSKRKYDRDRLGASGGTGTGYGVLAKDGMQVGGNLTEIQNTYAPGSLYDNLGYEPLNDSQKVKQYAIGGKIDWASDLTDFGAQNAGNVGNILGGYLGGGTGQSGAGKLGSGIGQIGGTLIGGPLGGVIGSTLGGLVGGVFGGAQENQMMKQQQKLQTLGGVQNIYGFQQANKGSVKNGGEIGLEYLSHDWQPQVITTFGEHKLKDLLREDETMNTLRSGGNLKDYEYTPLTQRAMSTEKPRFAMGGDIQVDDRGEIETQGYNPITAASGANGNIGITRGPSHDDGGFNVKRGDNIVEVEGGETASYKAGDGTSVDPQTGAPEEDFVILGDMKPVVYTASLLDGVNEKLLKKITKGKNLETMKFKNIGNEVAKRTGKLNKAESKYIDLVDSADDDLLKLNTGKVSQDGIRMQYKDLDALQNNLIGLQNAYHDTAKQHGYEDTPKFLEHLKQGKIKPMSQEAEYQAKFGGRFTQAQTGVIVEPDEPDFVQQMYQNPSDVNAFMNRWPNLLQSVQNRTQPVTMTKKDLGIKDIPSIKAPEIKIDKKGLPTLSDLQKQPVEKESKIDLSTAYNMLSPYTRRLIKNPPGAEQFAAPMYQLLSNTQDEVFTQGYEPMLKTRPGKISAQDMLDENQATFNALARQIRNNPSALATLAQQKYKADQEAISRVETYNQAQEVTTAGQNIDELNKAKLLSQDRFAKQAELQALAKSKTKAQTYEALASMADIIARNKRETLAANVQSGMYPQFTMGPKGRMLPTGLTQFNIPQLASYSSTDLQKILDTKKMEESKSTAKNTAKNGSLVKAIKNL